MARQQGWKTDPVAIVGASCRFPGGANSPSKLWQMLRDPPDLRKEIPLSKFNQKSFHHPDGSRHGSSNVSHSYVLEEDPGQFDHGFFNLHPKEAESMDPQQRILLEIVYEGIESAGYSMSELRGSSTGVFVGQMTDDYYDLLNRDVQCSPQYTATGVTRSIVANRVSYFFDWRGPSVNIDTACSSSLVALHLAVQALRSGETQLAVAAGVNLILGPEKYIYESQLSMLSPTGRSRMWDSGADGYARGEGFVAIVLKPLSQALADNDHIECIIRETGVNQDGRSDGLTVPSSEAQASLIRSTYSKCGLDWRKPEHRCQYFEAHGTGTQAGDPKEARAIHNAFFSERDEQDDSRGESGEDDPLYVGSIKTVIGHLEGAAGLAGLLKASLAVQQGQIPLNLHFKRLNPKIEPFYGHLEVPTSLQPWPKLPAGSPRRASVNSFGFGGTNAHAIIESWDPCDSLYGANLATSCRHQADRLQHYGPFALSAGSREGLMDTISALSHTLKAEPCINLQDLAWTLQLRREHFPVRASIAAADREQLIERLDAASRDADTLSMQSSQAVRVTERYPARILGIFTGQGAQWPKMGAGLYRNSARFRQSIKILQASLDSLVDPPSWSIDSELLAAPDRSRLQLAEIAQPLCTAVQIALVDLLGAAGISFRGVVGHSSGEIAAVYAAGYLDATDAIRIAYYRGVHSHLASSPTGQAGKMMAVGLLFQNAETFCHRPQFLGRIRVAASNARASVTISGDGDAIQEAKAVLDQENTFARVLFVDKAYHSHHMEPCAEPYLESLRICGIKVRRRSIHGDCTWYSSVHGSSGRSINDPDSFAGQYWVDNLVSPVMFSQALDRAVQEGQRFDLALEIGPHPALRGPATDLIKSLTGFPMPYSGVLRRNEDDLVSFSDALGLVWKNIDSPSQRFPNFQAFAQACEPSPYLFRPRVCKSLPQFPWDHKSSMLFESRTSKLWRWRPEPEHDLLGVPTVSGNRQEVRWRKIMRIEEMDWLRGHKFQNQVLFPAAGYVSMAVEAASYLVPGQPKKLIELNDIQIHRAITLSEQSHAGVEVTFTIRTRSQDATAIVADYSCFSIEADAGADENSHCNFTGSATIIINTSLDMEALRPLRKAPDLPPTDVSLDHFYSEVSAIGLDYSGEFLADSIHRRLGFATVSMSQRSRTHFRMDPAVLDASFHGVFAAFCYPGDGRMWTAYLPTSIRRVRITPRDQKQVEKKREFVADCFLREASEKIIRADVDIYSTAGGGLECQFESLTCTSFKTQDPDEDRKLFSHTVWRKDISSGIEGSKIVKASHADYRLYEVLERTSYFFLRRLRSQVSPSEIGSMPWHFQSLLGWVIDRLLPSIEQGQHPRVRAEWEVDQEDDIKAWHDEFPDDISLRAVHAIGWESPDIVRGNVPALQVLMQDGILDRVYKECIGGPASNAQAGELVGQLAHRYPQMKILEIGAGTGSMTETALKCLQSNFASYIYTDISPGFFEKAAASLSAHAHKMLFKTLDIERDPLEQGFEGHSFDVIMASNVLHATKSLDTTIANCHKLLRPGGRMILIEITSEPLWIQTIFSVLPGWWLGQEDGRMDHPSVSIDEWESILRRQEFSGVDIECRDSEDEDMYTFSVFTTQALDQRVSALRSPLDMEPSHSLSPKIDNLVIIGPEASAVADQVPLAAEVEKLLSPFANSVSLTNGLEDPKLAEGSLPLGTVAISLVDLGEATFRHMNQGKFQAIKTILDNSKHILWATKGCRADDPYANIMVGLGRSAMQELTHLGLQFVDLDPDKTEEPAVLLSNMLLRMLYADNPEFEDVLWSNETEIAIQDGNTYIPRILPENIKNHRVNSGKRHIQSRVSPSQHPVTLKRESPSGIFSLEQAGRDNINNNNNNNDDDSESKNTKKLTRLHVHYCSIFPVVTREGQHRFVCFGTDIDSGENLLALTSTNTSLIWVPSRDLIPTGQLTRNNAEQGLLRESLTQLVCENLIKPLTNTGATIWLHDTDAFVTSIASKVATAHGAKLFWTASTVSRAISDTAGGPRVIHPFITERDILGILPADVQCLITVGAESVTGVNQRLASYLSSNAKVHHLASEANHTGCLPVSLDLDEARECLRAAAEANSSVTGPLSFTPGTTVDRLPTNRTMAPYLSAPLDIVDWVNVENVDALVKPLDVRNMFSGNKTYFLVGLTGDVGLSLCDWMIDNGARHLALSSRKPNIDSRVMQAWERKGANVRVFALDVTDEQILRDVHGQIVKTMPPIGGVANAAMVLRDRPFSAMSLEDFDAVLAPKVRGSEHLDKIFYADDLDFFIFFSSMSRVAGTPGQSNYAAANMFMASLAVQRRARGVAASVVDIGMLVGFGWIWRNADEWLQLQMKQAAYMPISEPEFHTIMAEAIEAGRADGHLNPEIHTGLSMSNTASRKRFPRFSHIVPSEKQGVTLGSPGAEAVKTVRQQITEAGSDEDVLAVIEAAFSRKLRLVLQLTDTISPVDPKMALLSLGIDSLIAVELRSWFLKELAVDVPTLRILSDATIEDISFEAKSKLGVFEGKQQFSTPAAVKPNVLGQAPIPKASSQQQDAQQQFDGVDMMDSTASPSAVPSSSVDGRLATRSQSPTFSEDLDLIKSESPAMASAVPDTDTGVYERTGDSQLVSGQMDVRPATMDWDKEVAKACEELLSQPLTPSESLIHDGLESETDPNNLVVVLTGATGFLGSSILQRLVENPRVQSVHCIAIRRTRNISNTRRVSVKSDKIIEYPGDLEAPLLGLSEAEFDHLSSRADMIIHNAAQVSFLKPYQSLRRANVSSTVELCRLALARSIPLHFVSTGSVSLVPTIASYHSANEQVAQPALSEKSAADRIPEPSSRSGYRDSKWVAERILETVAVECGVPVWIHRPTTIVGDGAPRLDIMASVINSSRTSGKVPSIEDKVDGHLDLVSVQDVSGKLVDVALTTVRAATGGETANFVHHCSDRKFHPAQLKAYLEEQDGGQTSYEVVEFQAWMDAAARVGMDPLIHDFLTGTLTDGNKFRTPSLIRGD